MEGKLFGGQKAPSALTPSAPQTTLGSPTPRGLTPAPKPLTFAGVGSAWKKKGRDALTEFETRLGRTTTPAEREQMRQMIGYTDLTGEADVLGEQFDQWQQYAAQHTPGATWTPWSAPTTPPPGGGTTPTTPGVPTPWTPNPFPWKNVGPAPTFTPPPLPGQFQAPTAAGVQAEPGYALGLQQGQETLETGAAAQGILRTGKTLGDLARYGQDYATDAYDRAYNRAAGAYGLEMDRYGAQLGAAQAQYQPQFAEWQQRQRQAELDQERDWMRHVYGEDNAWRREEFMRNDEWRRAVYGTEDEYRRARDRETDAWKRYVLEEERRRFLAQMGQQ